MTLIAIVLTLTARCASARAVDLGRAHYAETLARLGRQRPDLAAEIHAANGPKPLTCSGLLATGDGPPDGIRRGASYAVRITGLTEAVSLALAEVFLRRPPHRWQLSGCDFDVAQVTCDAQIHPWAGQTTHGALTQRYREPAQAAPARLITLEFASPTAFRKEEMQMPLPLPGLVFGSLAERWNATAPAPLAHDVRSFAEQTVGISRFRLASAVAPGKQGALRIGGVGVVTYRVLSDDPAGAAVLNLLADFALYAGVGVQTTGGMGQCRRID